MKKLFALMVLLPAAYMLHAQGISAGIRAGVGYWCNSGHDFSYQLKALEGRHMSAVAEVFLRYTAKHKWVFEAAFNSSSLGGNRTDGEVYDAPWQYQGEVTDIRNLEGKFSLQYDLTCPAMKKCPLFSRMHSYVGISLSPVLANVKQTFYADYSPTAFMVWNNTSIQFWAGINHTMTFDLSKNFVLITVGELQVRPTELFGGFHPGGDYNPVAKFGFQLGGSYRF